MGMSKTIFENVTTCRGESIGQSPVRTERTGKSVRFADG